LSTLEGLEFFALGEGHRGVSSVGVLEYASGLRLVVCVFDSDRRLHRSSFLVCVASSVSFAFDVCILSTGQTKINTFTDKDIEVSQNNRFANENTGKKIVVFLAMP
jgi:hypothetical protein